MLIGIIGIFAAALQLLAAEPTLRGAQGFRVEVIANESILTNVVAFSIDESNQAFVAETHRNLQIHPASPEDDDKLLSVEDRAQYLLRRFPALTNKSERVVLLEDKDNDGKIDLAKGFASHFNRAVDGLAGGILARKGEVYFACVPDLWRLNGNAKESVHTGFGVHLRNPTHNLGNLILGPDDRLYFTMGDQGFNVQTQEGQALVYPNEGAILRCELNGARLEVLARGFKNPRGLAFNEAGDLLVIDGTRLIHVLEGLNATNATPIFDAPAPLTALGWKDRFYLADTNSIYSLKAQSKGLTYEATAPEPFIEGANANCIVFGPRPGLYFSEFRGRIYRVFDPSAKATRNTNDLAAKSIGQLSAIIFNPANRELAREALWKVGIGARKNDSSAQQTLLFAAQSKEPELRAQAAKALGDVPQNAQVGPTLLTMLNDPEPRVQFFAVQSLGRIKHLQAQSPLTVLSTQTKDPQLQHAIAYALQLMGY